MLAKLNENGKWGKKNEEESGYQVVYQLTSLLARRLKKLGAAEGSIRIIEYYNKWSTGEGSIHMAIFCVISSLSQSISS